MMVIKEISCQYGAAHRPRVRPRRQPPAASSRPGRMNCNCTSSESVLSMMVSSGGVLRPSTNWLCSPRRLIRVRVENATSWSEGRGMPRPCDPVCRRIIQPTLWANPVYAHAVALGTSAGVAAPSVMPFHFLIFAQTPSRRSARSSTVARCSLVRWGHSRRAKWTLSFL